MAEPPRTASSARLAHMLALLARVLPRDDARLEVAYGALLALFQECAAAVADAPAAAGEDSDGATAAGDPDVVLAYLHTEVLRLCNAAAAGSVDAPPSSATSAHRGSATGTLTFTLDTTRPAPMAAPPSPPASPPLPPTSAPPSPPVAPVQPPTQPPTEADVAPSDGVPAGLLWPMLSVITAAPPRGTRPTPMTVTAAVLCSALQRELAASSALPAALAASDGSAVDAAIATCLRRAIGRVAASHGSPPAELLGWLEGRGTAAVAAAAATAAAAADGSGGGTTASHIVARGSLAPGGLSVSRLASELGSKTAPQRRVVLLLLALRGASIRLDGAPPPSLSPRPPPPLLPAAPQPAPKPHLSTIWCAAPRAGDGAALEVGARTQSAVARKYGGGGMVAWMAPEPP